MTLSSPHSAGPSSHDCFFVRVPGPGGRGRACAPRETERRAVRENKIGVGHGQHVEEWGETSP
eukprot:scaffold11676_cov18-Phaeocystis_antarctica.AAC.1